MAISEAARADLYTGLAEVLGPERAETLMTHVPSFDPAEVATKGDIAGLRSDFASLRSDFAQLGKATKAEIADLREATRAEFARVEADMRDMRHEIRELRADMNAGFAAVNARFDRMYLALTAGLFVIVAAMIGVFFNTL